MSAAKEGTTAARARGSIPMVTSTVETTPSRGVDPATSGTSLASGASPPKASNADKTSAVAGLLERWPSSAAALLAQTMASPDASKDSNNQGGKFPVTGPLRGCSHSDLGMSPSVLSLLQSGAFMHTQQPSLLSTPQGEAAGGLMSQGCSSGFLSAAYAAALPAHLSNFPGSDYWGVSALTAASATSSQFLTNAAAASLLSAANVESGGLGCCFPDKLPAMPTQEQQQRGRHPQQQRQQQQQPLLSPQPPPHQPGCSPQDQQLLSISPILMMMPPGASGPDASATGGRTMGTAGEEVQQSTSVVPGGAQGVVTKESLPKVVGVRYDKVNKTWRASWYDPQSKRRVERKFSVNKLGFINAYNLATECRKLQEKKLGLRDRSGRKQTQQSESPAAGATQQMSSPNVRAALTGTSFPRFDWVNDPTTKESEYYRYSHSELHSSSAAAAAWEATASTVSPHMDLSLLGPSLKAFNTSSSSSSSSSLSMPPSQSAALLPMESLLSLTDHQHQQQLQQHHQLQQQQQQLHQQQQLQQQACIRQSLAETASESQQAQQLGSGHDHISASSVRGASNSSYLTRSVARAPDAERHTEKAEVSGVALGGTGMFSGSLSGLPQQLFDLSASRQQQQQQQRDEEYAAHHAAMMRRSFQAFEGGHPFLSSNTRSTCEQLSQRGSQGDMSVRDARTYYPYAGDGHNAAVERPADSPTTPHGTLRSSAGGIQRSTSVSGARVKGEGIAPTQAGEYKRNTTNSKRHEESKLSAEGVGHESSPLVTAATDPSLWTERTLLGEKRRLEHTSPQQQQRRTNARISARRIHSPGSMSEASAVSQQQEKHQHASQQGQQRVADDEGQRQPDLAPYDSSETTADSETRTSVAYRDGKLQTEDARQSLRCQEARGCTEQDEGIGRGTEPESHRVGALPLESDFQTSTVTSHNPEALAYKLRNRRSESNTKGRRSPHSDSHCHTPASSGGTTRTPLCDSHGENWKAQDEMSGRGRHQSFVEQSKRAPVTGEKYACGGCDDGRAHQHQRTHGTSFLENESSAEPANVESLPSPTGSSQTDVAAKDGRNSRTSGPLSDQRKSSCNRQQPTEVQRCLAKEQPQERLERDNAASTTRNEYDALCNSDTPANNRNFEGQQQCLRNNALPAKQQAGGSSAILRGQDRGRESTQSKEKGGSSAGVDSGLQQHYSANAASLLPRRKKQGAFLSPASFFAPSSPLGGLSFSLAAYAITSAANARETSGSSSRRSSLSSFADYSADDRVRYDQEGLISSAGRITMECSCGHAYPVMQEAGGGAAVVTRCRGGWCDCRARCGYKSQFLQKSARPGWQQLNEFKNEIGGAPAPSITSSNGGRNELKRFASLRLPRPVLWLQHPSAKERSGEDEAVHVPEWHKGEYWLSEGAGASTEDPDVSASTPLTNCSNMAKSGGDAVLEACTAAVEPHGELFGKGGKGLPQRNGSKEVLELVKELLLLLLQSLQEALTSFCRRRGATTQAHGESNSHEDRCSGKETRELEWERRSKLMPSSLEAPSDIADSSSNSSTCDSDDTATETSSPDGTSSITNKEALDCVAAVEKHTLHVRNAGKLDELALYTNLFQTCIRTRLIPTELPPLQVVCMLRQLMKAQLRDVNRSSQAFSEQESPQDSSSRSASTEHYEEDIDKKSSANEKSASASLEKTGMDPSNHSRPCKGHLNTLLNGRARRVEGGRADDSQREERSQICCTSHERDSACAWVSDEEYAVFEGLPKVNDCQRAGVHASEGTPAAEKNSGNPTRLIQQPSKERRESPRRLSSVDQTTKDITSANTAGDDAHIQASYAEDACSQERRDRNVGETVSFGKTANPSGKRNSLADGMSERIATPGNPRKLSCPRMHLFHDYNTRSRSDVQKQGKETFSREGYATTGEVSGRESGGRVALCGSSERMYAAFKIKDDLHSVSTLQRPVPANALADTNCIGRERLSSAESCSPVPKNTETRLPQEAVTDGCSSSSFFSDRKTAEARLALLASEILQEHEDSLILQRLSGGTSTRRTESKSVRAIINSLEFPIPATECEIANVARHPVPKGARLDDSVLCGEDEKQGAAAGGVATPLRLQSPINSAEEPQNDWRGMCRRMFSRGPLKARATTALPTTQEACSTGDFDESPDIKKETSSEADADICAPRREKPALDRACISKSASEEEERNRGTPTSTYSGKADCGGPTEEAERAEDEEASNTRSTYSSGRFGLPAQQREDTLAKLLL